MADHHTQLIELLGLTGFNRCLWDLKEKDLVEWCHVQLLAMLQACEAASAAPSRSSYSECSTSSNRDGGSSSMLVLTQQLHQQLILVIVELLALAPEAGILQVGLDILDSITSPDGTVPYGRQDTAEAVSRAFQPLALLVAPALLQAGGSGAEVTPDMHGRDQAWESVACSELMYRTLVARYGKRDWSNHRWLPAIPHGCCMRVHCTNHQALPSRVGVPCALLLFILLGGWQVSSNLVTNDSVACAPTQSPPNATAVGIAANPTRGPCR